MLPGGNNDDGAASTATRRLLPRTGFIAALVLVASGAGCAAGHTSNPVSATTPRQPDLSASGLPTTTPGTAVTTTTITAPTTVPAATPVMVTPQGGSVRRPSSMSMGGAHDLQITGITWSNWGSSSAQGTGSETASSCNPNCATGAEVTMVISMTLSQPQNGMFTLMTQQDNAGDPPSTWNYPSLWPVDAS